MGLPDSALHHRGCGRRHGGRRGNWDAFEIVCSMEDVEPGERFDGIAEVDAFMWFGIGVTYRVGNFRKWIES